MADFIAVIRRAVDGLSENTPEMRAKVYERAKSAVVRQLENMKPRPPEVMFQRQIDKLDAAIREVEAEHSEAVPTEAAVPAAQPLPEPPVSAPIVARTAPPAVAEPVLEREAEAASPSTLSIAEQAQRDTAVLREPEPVVEEREPLAEAARLFEAGAAAAPAATADPVIPDYVTSEPGDAEPEARLSEEFRPAQVEVAPYVEAPELGTPGPADYVPQPADAYVTPVAAYEAVVEPESEAATVIEVAAVPIQAPARPPVQMTIESELAAKGSEVATPELQVQARHAAEPDATVMRSEEDGWELEPLDRRAARVAEADRAEADRAEAERAEAPPPMPKVSYDETDVVEGFNDFLKQELNRQVVPPPPSKARKQEDFAWDAPFDDLPEIDKPAVFEQALEAKQTEIAENGKRNGNGRGKQKRAEPVSARAELEDLIGIDESQRRSAEGLDDAALTPDIGRAVSKLEGKTFRMQKKKKRRNLRLLPIGIAAAAVLLLSGSGYALWHYRDDVSQLVASLMPSQTPAKPATTPATDTKSDATPAALPDDETKVATNVKPAVESTEVASLNPDVGPQKFTQRLLPDGSEADTDAARVPIDQALQEGKSVAGQTEKSKEVAETTATDTKADATSTNPVAPVDQAQPLGATQKMYLYEERLGQSSPVAVPGTVVWKEKTDTEDGKPNPAIEAALAVPGRKISALITFKRNTDASLPASHIIEVVFALPKDFEEGNVDSIQRVAFKGTEQERGNPLIAVPAKITDDFHMVALNDDADARKVNLELMRTRGWIDIPITYRNGRRALITLEKGATGTAVFDKVMSEWDALGRQASTAN